MHATTPKQLRTNVLTILAKAAHAQAHKALQKYQNRLKILGRRPKKHTALFLEEMESNLIFLFISFNSFFPPVNPNMAIFHPRVHALILRYPW